MYDATREERAWIDLHIEIADAHAQTTAIRATTRRSRLQTGDHLRCMVYIQL
jgi:chorismate-pyruvate lyase